MRGGGLAASLFEMHRLALGNFCGLEGPTPMQLSYSNELFPPPLSGKQGCLESLYVVLHMSYFQTNPFAIADGIP